MSEKFQNKYRSESARLKNWDYGSNGAYFITICTKNREHFFGEIDMVSHTMQLNQIGKLAEQFWLEIPVHFPFVELGEFVVMPNHTHGVLMIDKKINPEPMAGSGLDSLPLDISLLPLLPILPISPISQFFGKTFPLFIREKENDLRGKALFHPNINLFYSK